MGDFIDSLNLGANLASAAQLQQLSARAAAAAAKEQRIEQLRDLVFRIGRQVQTLAPHAVAHPRGGYFMGLAMTRLLDEQGVDESTFAAFADKEYVSKVRAMLDDVTQRAALGLTTTDLAHVERTLEGVPELAALEAIANHQALVERITAMGSEWGRAHGIRAALGILGVGLLLLTPVTFCMLAGIALGPDPPGFFAFVPLLLPFAGFGLLVASQSGSRYRSLKRERQAIIKQMLPANVVRDLRARLGTHPSAMYRTTLAQRQATIRDILGPLENLRLS